MGKQGEKYQPSNGTAGMAFMCEFCENCIHDHQPSQIDCEIIPLTMCLDVHDKDYPSEWTYDEDGRPTCTKFKKWDWGDGGDNGDDWNTPPEPPTDDPNQLMMFSISDEIQRNHVPEENPSEHLEVGKLSE